MTDPKYDNPLPGPGGRKPGPGSVYIDPNTGETKQVVLGGRDTVLRPGATKKPTPPKQEKAKAKEGKIVSQEEYNAARKLMEETRDALALARFAESQIGDPVYQGKVYKGPEGKEQLKQIVDGLKTAADEASRKFKVVAEPIEKVQSQIDKIDKKLRETVSEGEKKAGAKPLTPAEKAKLKEQKAKLATKLDVGGPATPAAKTEKVPKPAVGAPKQVDLNKVMGPVAGRGTATPTVTTTPKATTGKTGRGVTGRGGGAGGTGTGGAGGGGVAPTAPGAPAKPPKMTAAEAFPEFAYMLDPAGGYEGVAEVFAMALDPKNKWYESEVGMQKFRAALQRTGYWQNTAASARNFDAAADGDKQNIINTKITEIKTEYGDLGLTESELGTLARDAARMGMTGPVLKGRVYSEVFKKTSTGQQQYGTAAVRATQGFEADTLRAEAKKYFATVTDADVEALLTGQKKITDFQRTYQELAKGRYSHLATQIDAGVTLEDIAAPYRDYASKVLEKDVNSIDMSSADYFEAISTIGPDGKPRQLNVSEWVNKLRSEPKYKWGETEDAKSRARTLVETLGKAFGKI